jgi:hypothetical protein
VRDLLPQEAAAREGVPDGALFAWVQPLQRHPLDRTRTRRKPARLWIDRRGQRPTETVLSVEHLDLATAEELAAQINRGREAGG